MWVQIKTGNSQSKKGDSFEIQKKPRKICEDIAIFIFIFLLHYKKTYTILCYPYCCYWALYCRFCRMFCKVDNCSSSLLMTGRTESKILFSSSWYAFYKEKTFKIHYLSLLIEINLNYLFSENIQLSTKKKIKWTKYDYL